jgi:hypothetical protein
LRSVNLRLLSNWPQSDNLPAQMERLAANTSLSLGLIIRK